MGKDGRSMISSAHLGATWTAGGVAETKWVPAVANHGGGYTYRLCKIQKDPMEMDEDCFQNGQLEFFGEYSWIEIGGKRNRIKAMQTTSGTHPRGSQWRKNPIPLCKNMGENDKCSTGPMFAPPRGVDDPNFVAPVGMCGLASKCKDARVIDKLKVPDVAAGEYILSWRWDCEQTPQVWLSCSRIRIIRPNRSGPATRLPSPKDEGPPEPTEPPIPDEIEPACTPASSGKCLENGKVDHDCCAIKGTAGCAGGFSGGSTNQECWRGKFGDRTYIAHKTCCRAAKEQEELLQASAAEVRRSPQSHALPSADPQRTASENDSSSDHLLPELHSMQQQKFVDASSTLNNVEMHLPVTGADLLGAHLNLIDLNE
jgi:hypothetical protein